LVSLAGSSGSVAGVVWPVDESGDWRTSAIGKGGDEISPPALAVSATNNKLIVSAVIA